MAVIRPLEVYRVATALSLFIAVSGAWARAALVVACDQPAGVYASGQAAVFTVTRTDASPTAHAATVRILRNDHEVVLTETIPGREATHLVRFIPKVDGWYCCVVTVPGWWKKQGAATGVVFNPDAYAPSLPAPADFDAFWAAQKARLASAKAVPVLTPLTPRQLAIEEDDPDHRRKIESLEKQGLTCENLEIPCLDVRPVEGYYAKPKSPVHGGHAAILLFHAAGVSGDWCRSSAADALADAEKYNAIVLDMNAHGMLNGQPQAYYDALESGALAGYLTQGEDSRDHFYFLGMFLRLLRGIDFLCAQPEWDGKHLICVGISQGGTQALAAAALDSRVSVVVATVPGLCDITGQLAGRPAGAPGIGDGPLDAPQTRRYIDTVRYFDVVNFCMRSKAETLITIGFMDTICPPTGTLTAYNQLKTAKHIITVPDRGHYALSVPTRELQARYDAFILAHTKN